MRLLETRVSRRSVLRGAALVGFGLAAAINSACSRSNNSENGNQEPNGDDSPEQNPDAGLITPEAGWKIYHGETYQIEFPEDWTAHDTSSDPGEKDEFFADGHFSNEEQDDKTVYINFSIVKLDPDETTIEDYKARVIRGILRDSGDEIIGKERGIQESEGQELLGQPSIELYYAEHEELNYPERVVVYDRKYLLRMQLMGRNVIRLYYFASSDNFDKYMPIFEHMASSLALK